MDYLVDLARIIYPDLLRTLYMVLFSTLFSVVLGLPLGIVLVVTAEDHIMPMKKTQTILSYITNMMRSLPFLILMILLFPLARWIVGTVIGSTAAIVPLSIAAAPFVARIVEGALKEVPKGMIEAAEAMGATKWEIVFKVLLPEALPSLVLGITLATINILGYSTMAGVVGGGGLGDLAIRYGFYGFKTDVMIATVIVLIVVVQVLQSIGNRLAKHFDKR